MNEEVERPVDRNTRWHHPAADDRRGGGRRVNPFLVQSEGGFVGEIAQHKIPPSDISAHSREVCHTGEGVPHSFKKEISFFSNL